MRFLKIAFACGIVGTIFTAGAAELNIPAVHFAIRTVEPVSVDGKLDEPGWKHAPVFTQNRGIGERKTAIRVLYDTRGIYFGIENWEPEPSKSGRAVQERDSAQILREDCDEIFLDPSAAGAGSYQFAANMAGAIYDIWEVDQLFTDRNWSASSAIAAVQVGDHFWTLEFFVGWQDLKKQGTAGALWYFLHRRHAYAGGVEEVYSSAKRFGYLVFVDGTVPDADAIAALVEKSEKGTWLLESGGKFFYHDGLKLRSGTEREMKAQILGLSQGAFAGEGRTLRAEFEVAAKQGGVSGLEGMLEAVRKASEIKQKNNLQTLFN